jgi:guanine deaminase
LDRVWYAATQEQAAAAGFDDSLFYSQIALSPERRIVPMTFAFGGDANEPFLAWRQFSAKVPY